MMDVETNRVLESSRKNDNKIWRTRLVDSWNILGNGTFWNCRYGCCDSKCFTFLRATQNSWLTAMFFQTCRLFSLTFCLKLFLVFCVSRKLVKHQKLNSQKESFSFFLERWLLFGKSFKNKISLKLSLFGRYKLSVVLLFFVLIFNSL